MSAFKKKTIRFLWTSLVIVLALCIGVFAWITNYMIRESNNAINEIGDIYMQEMNRQMELHFSSIINLRLTQVESIIWSTPPESVTEYGPDMLEQLSDSANARGFNYLALYSTQGVFDVIYGEEVVAVDDTRFLSSMNDDENKVAVGTTASGNKTVLLGVSVGYPTSEGYPMKDGSRCTALVAGLPIEYFEQTMSLDVDESMIYSHIIEKDGDFVVRTADVTTENYFEWLEMRYAPEDGEAIQRMRSAIEQGEECFEFFYAQGERRHVYCSPLPNSEWYLVTVMPYSRLDAVISSLGTHRMYTALGGCALILLALLAVFFMFYRMSQRQLRAMESAQAEAERANRAKSEFLSNMSHDIRTPMNAIVGMTAIATTNIDDTEKVKDCLRKITLSSKHLLGLINDVLDMSKIESGHLTLNMDVVCLRETVDGIVSIVQPQIRAKGQRFDIYIQNMRSERVYCDGVRLNQVLLNLLSNALKFTPEGGSITVTLAQEPSPLGEEYVRQNIIVADTGIGMSKEFQEHIFESFTREETGRARGITGTGLGMGITKHIVGKMNGSIRIESELEKGSTFYVTLDLKIAPEQEETMLLPDWVMLVVDDDAQLCQSAADALGQIGVRAEWTLNGASAVEKVETRHRAGQDYQAVLIDWQMPGMDGIETARRIRERVGRSVPILLISAYDWSDIEQEARDAGVDGFISKPLFKSTLYYGLNRFAKMPEIAQREPAEEQHDAAGRRLLVAEDNELNWEIANELLVAQGFEVEHALNGEICVEKFLASEPGHFDAVLMDIRMPVLNGYEAARRIRASERADSSLPIIAMTADAFSEDIQRALDSGMNAHVAKPIDMRELLRALDKCMQL